MTNGNIAKNIERRKLRIEYYERTGPLDKATLWEAQLGKTLECHQRASAPVIRKKLEDEYLALRQKLVCGDINGVEHAVEVTAESLHEAVAGGLKAFIDADWAADIGRGQTMIRVTVKQPEVEHKVRMRDFEAWLDSAGRSPAEMSLKSRMRQLLGT
jgi:hypothetical protein